QPDIRYIVPDQAPASLERYLQEAGRAGRDCHGARCILLFDESDLEIQEHLLALSRLSPALLGRFGRALEAYAGEGRDANIEELALSAGISQRAATSLVTTLVEAGICERVTGGRVHPTVAADTLVERVASLRSRFEVLRREDARRLRAVVGSAHETGCRRRRRGGQGQGPHGRPLHLAAPPEPAPLPTLPPLDAAADDLAAEFGAPSLPPPPSTPEAAHGAPTPRPPGHHRRRRRRRRRG